MTETASQAIEVIGANRPARWIITCDHATNIVPADVAGGDLGLPSADMDRHIAFDPGAAGVARALGQALDGPVVLSRFSRLVIDPNRGEHDPTLVMQVSDGSIIPGNRGVDEAEVERRLKRYHRPYHGALTAVLGGRADPIVVSVHSFTAGFKGRTPRPWHIGVLYGADTRLAVPVLNHLRRAEDLFPDLCVGDNQPYTGDLPGDALDRHGMQAGRLNVLIEVRNDLIETARQQDDWGTRLAQVLEAARADANL